MKKLQTIALAAIVAATIGLGGLAAAPAPAHAAPLAMMKCSDAIKLADTWRAVGDYWAAAGSGATATYYYARANQIETQSC